MKSEPRKQQLTVTLSDCTRSYSVANAKIYVLLYSFRFAYFELRAISKYKPRVAYIRRGDLTEGFLRYEFGGLIHGGAYFWNFTVY